MSGVRAGDIIAGKFQVERVLGEGGMGYVVAARHLQLGQIVALKFMRDEVCTNEYKSRFLREARNTVRLKSKHVSRVLDVGALEGGAPYMVMEYLEGTDLSVLLQQRGAFSVPEACEYIIQACEAIAEAHGHGIIHRDLKPANLFLTRGSGNEPVVKVLDFGVSKVLDLEASGPRHESVVTKVSDLIGSPTYMAPEQIVDARDADARSDVWSLGVILFRLLGGKPPFAGAALGDLINNIMYGPMPNLRALRPDLPAGLEQIVWRCLDRDRDRRPDVIELARSLAPYAGPNAAPSLERIAILGPALITSNSASFLTGGKSNWTTPPAPSNRLHDPRKDMSTTGVLVWGVVGAACVGSLAILGARFLAGKRPPLEPRPAPAVTFVPVPMPTVETPSVSTASAVPSVPIVPSEPTPLPPSASAPKPAASPSAKPSPHPTATHPKPRPAPAPAPKPSPPSDDIPSSRE